MRPELQEQCLRNAETLCKNQGTRRACKRKRIIMYKLHEAVYHSIQCRF